MCIIWTKGSFFVFFFETGKYCYSYESLNIAELKRGNCQQIKNATSQHWLKADCKIRSSGVTGNVTLLNVYSYGVITFQYAFIKQPNGKAIAP